MFTFFIAAMALAACSDDAVEPFDLDGGVPADLSSVGGDGESLASDASTMDKGANGHAPTAVELAAMLLEEWAGKRQE